MKKLKSIQLLKEMWITLVVVIIESLFLLAIMNTSLWNLFWNNTTVRPTMIVCFIGIVILSGFLEYKNKKEKIDKIFDRNFLAL
jgi:hypothetical protein